MSAPLAALEAPEPISVGVAPQANDNLPAADRVPVAPAPIAIAMRAIVDVPPESVRVPSSAPVTTTAAAVPPAQPAAQPQPAVPPPSAPRSVQALPPRPMPDVAAAVVPAMLVSNTDDRALVDQALQRYRRAYNKLDAHSARVVYPAVNEGALARAFGSLESQLISFESCDIDLEGRLANATCHGTSRYVPKIGNHEPRIEPRVWTFTLRKEGIDWTIENARAAR
jgi:hypothetical protein